MKAPLVGRVVLLASVVLLLVSGCAKEMTQPSTLPDESSSSVSESTGPSADEQAIIAAYKGYFETVATMGPVGAEEAKTLLAKYAVGPALENMVTVIENLRSQNQHPAGSVTFGEFDIRVNGTSAALTECRDGTTETIVDSTSGVVVSRGTLSGFRGELIRGSDGDWRVESYDDDPDAC